MKRRITDLFKKRSSDSNPVKTEPIKTSPPPKISYRRVRTHKGYAQYLNEHNQKQVGQANALRKRRKKNKVASKQRKLNSINS